MFSDYDYVGLKSSSLVIMVNLILINDSIGHEINFVLISNLLLK